MTNLYLMVAYVIIGAFVITFLITIIGLIKKDFIRDKYMKALFAKLILEVLAAFFFLFYQGFGQVSLDPAEAYAFNSNGEAVEFSATTPALNRQVVHLPKLDPDKFKPVARTARIEAGKLYLTAADGTYLGHFDDRTLQDVRIPLLTPQMALDLGTYLGIADRTTGHRRNPDEAVNYLVRVLSAPEGTAEAQKREAVRVLFHIRDFLTRPEQFEILVSAIETYRGTEPEHVKHKELGDAYYTFATNFPQHRAQNYTRALVHYLLHLSTPASELAAVSAQKAQAVQTATEIISAALTQNNYVESKKGEILRAIEIHDRNALRNHGSTIQTTT